MLMSNIENKKLLEILLLDISTNICFFCGKLTLGVSIVILVGSRVNRTNILNFRKLDFRLITVYVKFEIDVYLWTEPELSRFENNELFNFVPLKSWNGKR